MENPERAKASVKAFSGFFRVWEVSPPGVARERASIATKVV